MKAGRGTMVLVVALAVVFGIELATGSVGNESALLKLGALPDSGNLNGQYWRLATSAFLHFSWAHLLLNAGATLGASGAIFGLLATALVLVHRRDTPGFGRERRLRAWLWVALIAALGVSFLPGISLAGHVGGLACGAALGTIVKVRGDVDRIAGGSE